MVRSAKGYDICTLFSDKTRTAFDAELPVAWSTFTWGVFDCHIRTIWWSKQIKNIYLKSVTSKSAKFRQAFDIVPYSDSPYHQLNNFFVAKDANVVKWIVRNSEKRATARIIYLALDFMALTKGWLEPDVLTFTRKH
jgi:hypothetical protein